MFSTFLKDMPGWVFHGAKDPTVPLKRSTEMVDALKQVGNTSQFTVYLEGGHGIWNDVYKADELYSWMARQVRGKPDSRKALTP